MNKLFYCFITLFYLSPVCSQTLNATFLYNNVHSNTLPEDGISLLLRNLLSSIPEEKLISRFHKVPRGRDWELLKSSKEYCVYNKLKNEERESYALFSSRPISIFASNRIIARKPNLLPNAVSIPDVVFRYKMRLGWDINKSYGTKLDDVLATLKTETHTLSGTDTDYRLIKLIISNRIDALIDYSATFYTNMDVRMDGIKPYDRYSVHQIVGEPAFVYGYVACSKTDIGTQIIELVDNAMKSREFELFMSNSYRTWLSDEEFNLLIPELESKFNMLVREP